MKASTSHTGLFLWLARPLLVILASVVITASMISSQPVLAVLVFACLVPIITRVLLASAFGQRPVRGGWWPRRCPGCGAQNLWAPGEPTPVASCRTCRRHFKRIGLTWREIEFEKLPRQWTAGTRRAFRAFDSPHLAPSALEPVVDRSTCGRLLGMKRHSDPSDLIKRDSSEPAAGKPKPVPGMLTTLERLLWRKRWCQGSIPTDEPAGGGLWDPWLDG